MSPNSLPLPPKTWVARVTDLHPSYVEIAFALENANNSIPGVSDNRLLCIEGDCVLCLVTDFADRQQRSAHICDLPGNVHLVVLAVFEWGQHLENDLTFVCHYMAACALELLSPSGPWRLLDLVACHVDLSQDVVTGTTVHCYININELWDNGFSKVKTTRCF